MSKKATGISNAHYAVFDPSKNVYGTPKPIIDLESISITESYAEGSNYADNLRNIYLKELVGADLSLTFSNISREIEAELTGQACEKGELEYKTSAIAPQIALLFEKNYSDGTSDRIVYYNCKLSKDSENGETRTDSYNFVEDTLSGQAIPMSGSLKTKDNGTTVTLNGVLKFVIDSKGANSTSNTEGKKRFDNFFTRVQFKGVNHTD